MFIEYIVRKYSKEKTQNLWLPGRWHATRNLLHHVGSWDYQTTIQHSLPTKGRMRKYFSLLTRRKKRKPASSYLEAFVMHIVVLGEAPLTNMMMTGAASKLMRVYWGWKCALNLVGTKTGRLVGQLERMPQKETALQIKHIKETSNIFVHQMRSYQEHVELRKKKMLWYWFQPTKQVLRWVSYWSEKTKSNFQATIEPKNLSC